MFKRFIVLVLILSFLISVIPSIAFAEGDMFDTTLKGAVYGGIIGSLVGAAFMAFTDKPEDNLDYIVYGAAGGIIVGTAIGVATSARAMVEIDDSKFTLNMPDIKTDIIKNRYDNKTEVVNSVNLLRINF